MKMDESILDAYIYETQQLLQSMEDILFVGENEKKLNGNEINEIFRIMHTIKGSSSMMEFEEIAKLAHILEDMFSQIRDDGAPVEQWPEIFDLVFAAVSFFDGELAKLLDKAQMDGDASELEEKLKLQLGRLSGSNNERPAPSKPAKGATGQATIDMANAAIVSDKKDVPYYKIRLLFEEGCQMEGLRAFGVVQSLKNICVNIATVPENLDLDSSSEQIRSSGLCLFIQTIENPDKIKSIIGTALFVKNFSLLPIEGDDEEIPAAIRRKEVQSGERDGHMVADVHTADNSALEMIAKQNFISVNVNKLDNLLNIVGEIVTAQSMVINNADFGQMQHESFDAAAQQLHSRINELQDIVMSIRMIPVSTLFQKMRRLVRDMSKKFGKEIDLELIGEETEVDKNVIDTLSDPLLHIIRNSVDHGIEDAETRKAAGKPARGRIRLEARTTGSDVIVTVSDDGKGLQRDAILKKAFEKGLISRPDEALPDKDVFAMIFMPGFSTKDEVTEFSGRGVGMDVVRKNISQIGGSVTLESEPGKGTTHIIRIPLTLTIVDGMKFNIGNMNFIVPTVSVMSAVKPNPNDIFKNPEGSEMIMLLGKCYSLIRLNEFFHISGGIENISEGMIMHIASDQKEFCIFFDHLEGEHQVVVKTLPGYLQKCSSSLEGIGGCAIMGDGSINMILDVNGIQ